MIVLLGPARSRRYPEWQVKFLRRGGRGARGGAVRLVTGRQPGGFGKIPLRYCTENMLPNKILPGPTETNPVNIPQQASQK